MSNLYVNREEFGTKFLLESDDDIFSGKENLGVCLLFTSNMFQTGLFDREELKEREKKWGLQKKPSNMSI